MNSKPLLLLALSGTRYVALLVSGMLRKHNAYKNLQTSLGGWVTETRDKNGRWQQTVLQGDS